MWSYTFLPRLGLPLIGAGLKAVGHDVLIYCPQFSPIDWDDVLSADLVGLSTTTSTAPAAYEISARVRAHGVPTIVGGSHVTFMADEALAHADYVARGEGGDALMLELIAALRGRRDLETIAGLSFTRAGVAVHNPPRQPCRDLDTLPVPDLTLIAGSFEQRGTTPIMTSWGCPFACNFCSVTAMFGRKYRYRSPEHIMAEIEAKQPRSIFFYDDNFAADKRRLKTLLGMMIERDIKPRWMAQVRSDVARDEELLALMRQSGCNRLALGFESVDQATLDSYAKAQTVADITDCIAALHRHGIKCHGMFVIGADNDTARTADDTVAFAEKYGIDSLMLNVLTPGLGTKQYEMMNGSDRVFEERWQFYDGQHVIFEPQNMTPVELQTGVVKGYRHFYSLRRSLKYLVRLRFERLLEHLWGWWYIRRWQREPANRTYIRQLAGRCRYAATATPATPQPAAAQLDPPEPAASAGPHPAPAQLDPPQETVAARSGAAR